MTPDQCHCQLPPVNPVGLCWECRKPRAALTSNQQLAKALREAAARVVNHCFKKAGDSALMSIPARPDYDVDLLLMEAASRLSGEGTQPDETSARPCGETGHLIADETGHCTQCGLPVTAMEGMTAAEQNGMLRLALVEAIKLLRRWRMAAGSPESDGRVFAESGWNAGIWEHQFSLPSPRNAVKAPAEPVHKPSCTRENARIDGIDRWYMRDCDCGAAPK